MSTTEIKLAAALEEVANLSAEVARLNRIVMTCSEDGASMKNRHFSVSGDHVYDENFDYDAKLVVSGDFGSAGDKQAYAQMIADALNGYRTMLNEVVGMRLVVTRMQDHIHRLQAQNIILAEQKSVLTTAILHIDEIAPHLGRGHAGQIAVTCRNALHAVGYQKP